MGAGRAFSPRHVAYYQRRAAGGAGLIVTETASVHPSDWPYERAPLAGAAADGWRQIAAACQPHGTLVLAGLRLEGRRRAREIGALEAGDRGTAAAETGALDTSARERSSRPRPSRRRTDSPPRVSRSGRRPPAG